MDGPRKKTGKATKLTGNQQAQPMLPATANEGTASNPQIEIKKKSSSIAKKVVSVMAFLVGFFFVSFLLSQGSSATDVHITSINYHYYNPQSGYNWTYSLPEGFDMQTGSTVNGSYPFTSNLTCSMTLINAYAITPGFGFNIPHLPVTFGSGQTSNFNIDITAPSYQYSGPLNVQMVVTYGPGC